MLLGFRTFLGLSPCSRARSFAFSERRSAGSWVVLARSSAEVSRWRMPSSSGSCWSAASRWAEALQHVQQQHHRGEVLVTRAVIKTSFSLHGEAVDAE